jgi:hypothetical protein
MPTCWWPLDSDAEDSEASRALSLMRFSSDSIQVTRRQDHQDRPKIPGYSYSRLARPSDKQGTLPCWWLLWRALGSAASRNLPSDDFQASALSSIPNRPIFPKPVRYASPTVTVCIAAKALASLPIRGDEREFHSAIVLCMDMMGSTEYSSAENTPKHCFLPKGLTALISGSVPVAREFSAILSEQLESCALEQSEIIARLRRSMTINKQRHADEHLGARVGMSYADFQKSGAKALPEDLYRDLAW